MANTDLKCECGGVICPYVDMLDGLNHCTMCDKAYTPFDYIALLREATKDSVKKLEEKGHINGTT